MKKMKKKHFIFYQKQQYFLQFVQEFVKFLNSAKEYVFVAFEEKALKLTKWRCILQIML